jgi:hypothetical protein
VKVVGQAPVQVQTILEEAALWGTGLEALHARIASPTQASSQYIQKAHNQNDINNWDEGYYGEVQDS